MGFPLIIFNLFPPWCRNQAKPWREFNAVARAKTTLGKFVPTKDSNLALVGDNLYRINYYIYGLTQ
jgi:hypothetical protein